MPIHIVFNLLLQYIIKLTTKYAGVISLRQHRKIIHEEFQNLRAICPEVEKFLLWCMLETAWLSNNTLATYR